MAEITIPAPIECTWVGDWGDIDGERPVGSVGYWLEDTGRLNPALTGRRPIWVMCPAWYRDGALIGTPFCIDNLSTAKNQPWDLTVDMDSLIIGQKPMITVHPSIYLLGIWHGWLQRGVLNQTGGG